MLKVYATENKPAPAPEVRRSRMS